jgi:hypothetical protein
MIVNQLITNPFEIQFNSGRSLLVWQRGKGLVRERKKKNGKWQLIS